MPLFELIDRTGDTGMLVAGLTTDLTFREEADRAGRTDELLRTVTKPEDLLTQDALALAVRGVHKRSGSHRANLLADSNR